jgi:hypothetical protein
MVVKANQTANENAKLYNLASVLVERTMLGSRLGLSYKGRRDIYEALGYDVNLTYVQLETRYFRDPVAKRIINAPAEECWSDMPEVIETDVKDTPFEIAWGKLSSEMNIINAFVNVDKLSAIGEYAVLLLGFDDGDANNPVQPITNASNLLYATPYSQDSATISSYDLDRKSPRYGLPEIYNLRMGITTVSALGGLGRAPATMTQQVHHSRIIHVAEDMLKNRIFGTPRLMSIWNNLINLELVSCSSSEMFWRGARPGFALKQDAKAAELSVAEKKEYQEKVEEYVHGFQSYMALKGISIEQLSVQLADPASHIEKYLDLISIGCDMPKRVLVGSERGELASSLDERTWSRRMVSRQQRFCEPVILWPTINRLIDVGVLPKPTNNLEAHWKDLMAPGAKEVADTGLVRAQSIAALNNSPGVTDMYPQEFLDRNILGLSNEDIVLLEKQRQAQSSFSNDPIPENIQQEGGLT